MEGHRVVEGEDMRVKMKEEVQRGGEDGDLFSLQIGLCPSSALDSGTAGQRPCPKLCCLPGQWTAETTNRAVSCDIRW